MVAARQLDPAAQAALTEKDFRRQVRDIAKACGWDLVAYFPSVLTVHERGWPDLVLVRRRDRRLIFAELKSAKGKLSAEQAACLDVLSSVEWNAEPQARFVGGRSHDYGPRIEVCVWRPGDYDLVVEVLR